MTVPDVTPDPPGRAWRTVLAILTRLPQASLSRGMGRVADIPVPPRLRKAAIGAFARALGIDVSEAELPFYEYPSLNAFFVRRLRQGLRQWPDEDDVLASPVDGVLGQLGQITSGRLIQAKGRSYAAADLLGGEDEGERYEGGVFLTLYLSPRHYHRIHTPAPGAVSLARHLPGALLPVNAAAVNGVEDLFPRNERLVCFVDGAIGRVAVVAVGAYNVGRISARFDEAWSGADGSWITNRRMSPPPERRYDPPIPVGRGEEIMAFHLGSTVVLLVEPGRVRLDRNLAPGMEVKLGDALARPDARENAMRLPERAQER
jgi:phosphatidylserine decarboxylase